MNLIIYIDFNLPVTTGVKVAIIRLVYTYQI